MPAREVIDAAGGFVGPALVDPHTHLVYAGNRADEFELRCQGKTYVEISKAGGGIMRTVAATRAASEDELVSLALPRLAALLSHGVLTAEVKSGYGLDVQTELKMLRVIKRLNAEQPITLIPTVLALHARPDPSTGSGQALGPLRGSEDWVDTVIDELLPKVAAEKLAVFCDAFVETTAFTADEARRVMKKAVELGLIPRLHVDQLTPGAGAELAGELQAATADHLEHISAAGMRALASAGVVAVLNPTSTLFLRERKYAPGRHLIDNGVCVALCTNCNPGSSNTENVALAMSLACLENGLTPYEAYLGFTRNAARALRLPEAGRLVVGGPADAVIYDCKSYRTLPYHLGGNEVRAVLKEGRVVR
jgi:imidazolonepropionase